MNTILDAVIFIDLFLMVWQVFILWTGFARAVRNTIIIDVIGVGSYLTITTFPNGFLILGGIVGGAFGIWLVGEWMQVGDCFGIHYLVSKVLGINQTPQPMSIERDYSIEEEYSPISEPADEPDVSERVKYILAQADLVAEYKAYRMAAQAKNEMQDRRRQENEREED